MNKLGFLFLILVAVFASCDGRDRVYKSNKAILIEDNLFDSFSERVKFTPKVYTEIKTDTLLANQFNIKIKYFSLDKDQILQTENSKDELKTNHYYKNFEAILKVSKASKPISLLTINKHLFSDYETRGFWDNAIMQFVWVDYEKTTETSINLNVSFCTPKANTCKDYTIVIYENGNIRIEKSNLVEDIT